MKHFLVCISLLLLHSAWAQIDVPVVGNKDGQWRIINKGKEIIQSRTVHFISHFDSKGLAYFKENNKCGIINSEGEIIYEPFFRDISIIGDGIFNCISNKGQQLVDFSSVDLHTIDCLSALRLDDKWYTIKKEEGIFLFNYESKKTIEIESIKDIRGAGQGYVGVKVNDSTTAVYNTEGEEFILPYYDVAFAPNVIIIETESFIRIVYNSQKLELPADATIHNAYSEEILYSVNGKSYWVNPLTMEVELEIPYELELGIGNDDYLIHKNGKIGLYHKGKGVIISPTYDDIEDWWGGRDDHLIATKNTLSGLIDRNGKVILPCKYQYIYEESQFYYVSNSVDLVGLISKKNNRTLLQCMYDRVIVDDNEIRAYSGTKMRILKLDDNHNTVSDVTLKNIIQLHGRDRYRRNESIDFRLFELGWFTEKQKKFDKDDFFLGFVDNWGFKDKNDSILVKAKHAQPKFIVNASYTLVPQDSFSFTFREMNFKMDCDIFCSNTNGRSIFPEKIFGMDTMDLTIRNFARFSGEKGLGFITPAGQVEYVSYFDTGDHDYIRYCESGELVHAKYSDPESVQYPPLGLDLGERRSRRKYDVGMWGISPFSWKEDGEDFTHIKFEEAKWNFMDTSGAPLFSEPFDYVNEFHKNRSIAKKKGKWGLIDYDTTVIQFEYSTINRVREYGDTVFLVSKSDGGSLFLDTNLVQVPTKITGFVKNKGTLTQVLMGRSKFVINDDYKKVSGDARSQKLMEGNWFYAKSKGVVSAYDDEGFSLGEYSLKPLERFGEDAFLFKSGSKYGVMNGSGDTVIQFKYKSIVQTGNYYFAKNGFENILFDEDFNVLIECKTAIALGDAVTNDYATSLDGKVTIYDGVTGKKKAKLKEREANYFHNGWLFQFGKISNAYNIKGELKTFKYEMTEIEPLGDYGYLIKDKERIYHVLSPDLINMTRGRMKKSRYLGHGFVVYNSTEGVTVSSAESSISFKKGSVVQGTFDDKYILVKEEGKYFFLNKDLKNPFNRYFIGAEPFKGNYTAVQEHEGWTIIDINGTFQTLPTYRNMKLVGPNLFTIPSYPLYGLIDNDGNEILPTVYKNIAFINSDLIQVIYKGDIKYFNASGTELKIYK